MKWMTSSLFIVLLLLIFLFQWMEGAAHPAWMSFVYFYGLGLPIYAYVSYLMVHFEAVDWSSRLDRIWFCAIHIGMIVVCCVHAGWTWLALHSPYKGGL